jgi:SAM-dependent methyltransferase
VSDELTRIENESILAFLHSVADEGYLRGRVLDYGCGRAPYRRLVEEHGGEWFGYDDPKYPDSMASRYVGDWSQTETYNAILCTQVLQFVPDIPELLRRLHGLLRPDGDLVMTYTTNWPEVNAGDLHRHTRAGMAALLDAAGFSVLRHDRRATIHAHEYEWPFGYGVVAKRSVGEGWPVPAALPTDYWETAT